MSVRSYFYALVLVSTFLTKAVYAETMTPKENQHMPVNVVITFNVKSDKLDSFKDILGDVKKNLPTVAGCNGVVMYNNADDPNVFTLVEAWDSQEQHQAHLAKVVESGDWDMISEHLTADPVSGYFTEF